jgi:hypothetical protein
MSTTKGTTKPKPQPKPNVEESKPVVEEAAVEETAKTIDPMVIQEKIEKPKPEELVGKMVKIKPFTTYFVGGNGIPDAVRNAPLFISRANQNGTVVVAYASSLIEIDALFVDDIVVTDDIRTYHDEETECPKVSIRIFGVPERMDCIRENQKRLGIPDELIFIDENHDGCIPTAKKAWSYPTDKEFVLVLQDDVELCDNFIKYLNAIVDAQPDSIISLFSFQLARHASVNRVPTVSPYVEIRQVTAQGLVMPTAYVQPCIEAWKDNINGDDTNITEWAKENGIRMLTTLPATIQHIGIKSVFDPARSLGMSEFYDKNPVDAAWDNSFITNIDNIIRS